MVVATPTGVGVGYEGEAVEMQGPGPFWLLVGCDGLWDFMKEGQIQTVSHLYRIIYCAFVWSFAGTGGRGVWHMHRRAVSCSTKWVRF